MSDSISNIAQLQYAPLNPAHSEVRLLRFMTDGNPCSESQSPPTIRLTLHIVSLDHDKPEFRALSYVWGDAVKTALIDVNSATFAATLNLVDALRVLAQNDLFRAGAYLWVDAICINQHDISERNQQVGLMSRIYRESRETLAWLHPEGGVPFDNLMQYYRAIFRCDPFHIPVEEVIAACDSYASAGCDVSEPAVDTMVQIYKRFHTFLVSHSYWQRCWTVQEFLLPDRVVFFCGDGTSIVHSELWDGLRWCAWACSQDGLDEEGGLVSWTLSKMHTKVLIEAPALWMCLVKDEMEQQRSLQLGTLLVNSSNRESLDPRDAFYSLAGLVDLPFPVDYGLPERDVFLRATKEFLWLGGFPAAYTIARVGSAVRGRPRDYQLPSWAIVPGVRHLVVLHDFDSYEEPAEGPLKSDASAFLFPDGDGGDTAVWRGCVLDRVEAVKRPEPHLYEGVANRAEHLRVQGRALISTASFLFGSGEEHELSRLEERFLSARPYVGGGVEFYAWVRLALYDHVNAEHLEPYLKKYTQQEEEGKEETEVTLPPTVLTAIYTLLHLIHLSQDPDPLKSAGDDGCVTNEPNAASSMALQLGLKFAPGELLHRAVMSRAVWNERAAEASECLTIPEHALLRTELGYIGVSQLSIREGDVVCAFPGLSIPMILRAVGNHYEIVSAAYVVGLMNAQAAQRLEDGLTYMQNFVIR